MVCGRVHWMRGGVVMVSMSRVPRQLENASGKLLRRRPMALTQWGRSSGLIKWWDSVTTSKMAPENTKSVESFGFHWRHGLHTVHTCSSTHYHTRQLKRIVAKIFGCSSLLNRILRSVKLASPELSRALDFSSLNFSSYAVWLGNPFSTIPNYWVNTLVWYWSNCHVKTSQTE